MIEDIERLKRELAQRRATLRAIVNRVGAGRDVLPGELAGAMNEIERAAVALAFAEERFGLDVSDPNERSIANEI